MILGSAFSPEIAKSSFVAYVHYLSFMVCFGALILERKLLRVAPSRQEAISIVLTDIFYGLAALALLVSGILRVLYFGKDTSFYTENPLFWVKVGIFLGVGTLSLYPTITFIRWAIPLTKGQLPQVSPPLVTRLGWIINIEIIGFALIPLFATLMSRGIGLN